MTEDRKLSPPVLENESRRKAVKTIVGGVTVLAAYHTMPVNWGTPIIEQVFLPAHAATSGSSLHDPCTVTRENGPRGTDNFLVEGYVTPPTGGLSTKIVLTPSLSGSDLTPVTATTKTLADGTFSATLNVAEESDRVDVTTTVEGADGSASCFSVKPDEGCRAHFINSTEGNTLTVSVPGEDDTTIDPGDGAVVEYIAGSPLNVTQTGDLATIYLYSDDGEDWMLGDSTANLSDITSCGDRWTATDEMPV